MPGAAAPERCATAAYPRIGRVAARRFAGRSELSVDPDLRVYLSDLVRPYGVALREDLLERGVGHTYGEMAEELIRETVPEDGPVDLLILAYAVHDVRPGRSTALYLGEVCPGRPMAFTVCDQGIAGPYTAVRLASEYLRTGDRVRALIIVAEQAALHYEPPTRPDTPVTLPDEHSAVAVLFEGVGATGLSAVREHAGIAPGEVPELLVAQVSELAAGIDRGRRVLVLGGGLSKADAEGLGIDRIVAAPAGRPCTGVWHELAQGHAQWSEHGDFVILADYDRQLRTLCLCAIETGGAS
ncbi:MAG TPA: hypothetical protein VGS97_04820 [Actinocrinis sp.]|uniref:hypothetical protein n=1 Tax=Actinocrinis sp. TaxID=1920516 RepID=UPI002DDD3452|nr:hypothetical protein [Actinocrinis sp.]HEV2343394.1 hypothetical protein [Actinocrinis sp.]